MLIRDAIALAFYLHPEPMTANEILEFIQSHNWYEFGTAPVETIRSVISQVMRGSMKGIRMEKIRRGSYRLLEAPEDLAQTLVSAGLVPSLAVANQELHKMYSILQQQQQQDQLMYAQQQQQQLLDPQMRPPPMERPVASKAPVNKNHMQQLLHAERMKREELESSGNGESSPKRHKKVGAFVEPASMMMKPGPLKRPPPPFGELLQLQDTALSEPIGSFVVSAGWAQQAGTRHDSSQNTDRFWMSIASNSRVLLQTQPNGDSISITEGGLYSPAGTPPLVSVSSILNLSSPQPAAYVPSPTIIGSLASDTIPPSMVMPPPPQAVHLSQVSSPAVSPVPLRAPVPQSALSLLLKASETGSSSGESTPTFFSPPPSPVSTHAAQLLMRLMPHGHSIYSGFSQPYAGVGPSASGPSSVGQNMPFTSQRSLGATQLHTTPFSIFIIADGQGGPSAPIFFQEEGSIQMSKLMAEKSEWLFDDVSERQYFTGRVQAVFRDLDSRFLKSLRDQLRVRNAAPSEDPSNAAATAAAAGAGGPFSNFQKGAPPVQAASGSTLTVVVVLPRWFVCCHVGNTRAILAAHRGSRWEVVFTSVDDVEPPNSSSSSAAPAEILNIYDIAPYRMNLSASMGHLLFKLRPEELKEDESADTSRPPLSCLPHVTFISLSTDVLYMLLLASDGLWSHMVYTDIGAQNTAVTDYIQQRLLRTNLKQIATDLCQRKGSMFKPEQEELDEVTCCVSLIFPTGRALFRNVY